MRHNLISSLILLGAATLSQSANGQVQSVPNATLRSPRFSKTLAFLQGLGGNQGSIGFHDSLTGEVVVAPPSLRRVSLLGIDVVGRTVQSRWDPEQVRHRADVPNGRLILPHTKGSLYRYSRVAASGVQRFGFLLLRPTGGFQRLAERSGWGPGQSQDPYLEFVAFDPEIRRMLLATVPGAGGDLIVVDLNSGATATPTQALPPLTLGPASHGLAADWGYGVALQNIVRFDLDQPNTAAIVPIPSGTPPFLSQESAWSPGRTRVVTTGGSSAIAQFPLVFARTGTAQIASSAPANMVGASYLPMSASGPTLAVDDSGECVAWVAQEPTTRELYVSEVAQAAPHHVSSDDNFADTFGETGVISVQVPGTFLFAVGSPDGRVPGGVEGADFYSATLLPGGGFTVANVTATSGDLVAPYEGDPTVTPQEQLAVPGAGTLIYDDEEGRLLVTDGTTASTLMQGLKDHDFFLPVDGGILAGLRLDSTNAHGVWFVPEDLSTAPVLIDSSNPDSGRLSVVRLSGPRVGYVLEVNDAPALVGVLNYSTGVRSLSPTGMGPYGLALSPTPGGGLSFVRQNIGGNDLPVAWEAPGALVPMDVSLQRTTLLPAD